ncbi:MAG: hypothetical protein ABI947_22795 [Chloroflexota bacterium]
MIRKAIGTILLIVAGVITVLLLTGGGPLVPHMVGPITLAVVGVILLTRHRNAEHPAE